MCLLTIGVVPKARNRVTSESNAFFIGISRGPIPLSVVVLLMIVLGRGARKGRSVIRKVITKITE